MKLKPWIHSTLHIGCVALLLLQGYRIQRLKAGVVEQCRQETKVTERLFATEQMLRGTEKALANQELCVQTICGHTRCSGWCDETIK